MVKAKIFFSSIALFLLFVLQACGPDFNTDFDPPPPDAIIEDIFPQIINDWQRKIENPKMSFPYKAAIANYGDGRIIIDAIRSPNKGAADNYFKKAIVPNFDKMKNHYRGNINGSWSASGTDDKGRRWYAWVNNNWIFMINGSNKENFKMAIDAFKYVEE